MSAHPCSQKLGGLHAEEEGLSIVAVEATDGTADGMEGRRRKRREDAVHSTLPWSSSKLDKEDGFRVQAWLPWPCGDLCLQGRKRAHDLFRLAR